MDKQYFRMNSGNIASPNHYLKKNHNHQQPMQKNYNYQQLPVGKENKNVIKYWMTAYNTKLISEITLYLRNPYHFLPGLLEVQEYLIRAGTPHLHNGGQLDMSLVVDIFTSAYIGKHMSCQVSLPQLH